jgi:hypothetical protein
MSINPFEDDRFLGYPSYHEFIKSQLVNFKVGESRAINTLDVDIKKCRASISCVTNKLDGKFKTKRAIDGSLWIKRIE